MQTERRGRPRKLNSEQSDVPETRPRWSEDGKVFFLDGWVWVTELVEKAPEPSAIRSWEGRPICLGREGIIIPILKGESPIPENMYPRCIVILEKILEDIDTNGRYEANPRAIGLQRRRLDRTLRHRQKDTRRLKAREGLSSRQAHYKGKNLSSR